jgi:phosphinothricin acetyltransferase
MTIRPAQPTDANAICAIWNAVIEHTNITFTTIHKTQAEVKTLISDRGAAFIVATDTNQITGFATYGPFRSGPGYKDTVEHSVYVLDRAHGTGVAQALMTQLADVARTQGKRIMIAAITGDNEKARAFHSKMGFIDVAYMPEVGQKFGRLHDLCIMQKKL